MTARQRSSALIFIIDRCGTIGPLTLAVIVGGLALKDAFAAVGEVYEEIHVCKQYMELKEQKAQHDSEAKKLEEKMKEAYAEIVEEMGVSCTGVIKDGGTEYVVSYNRDIVIQVFRKEAVGRYRPASERPGYKACIMRRFLHVLPYPLFGRCRQGRTDVYNVVFLHLSCSFRFYGKPPAFRGVHIVVIDIRMLRL